jgi:hypothetical protein
VNDAPSRLTRRTLAVIGAASAAAGLTTVGRPATALSQSSLQSDDALVIDEKGNVGIGKAPGPDALLDVGGKIKSLDLTVNGPVAVSGALSFGEGQGQRLNLWQTSNAIGIQLNTQYFRSTKNFAWFTGGTHNDNELNPGGGTLAMALSVGQLDVNGLVKATKFAGDGAELTGPLTITVPTEKSSALAISGTSYLEFGAGLTKADKDAGKIGYGIFSGGLDIVGAGEKKDLSDRKITLHSQGGVTVLGPLLLDGFLAQNNPTKVTMRAKVKAVLTPCPVGTVLLYIMNDNEDPCVAWKNKDGKVRSAELYRTSGGTVDL